MPGHYTLADHSPNWSADYVWEAESLTKLLGDELILMYHIGSTSVPGLAAKPIIDIMPVVRDIQRIDGMTAALQQSGYHAWGDYGVAGRRLFTKDQDGFRTHDVHIYELDHTEVERYLAFCAYLRVHKQAREEFDTVKRQAFAEHPADIDAYNQAKNSWINHMEPLAIRWYRRKQLAQN